MDAIGQLTGGVAHDFNNLLTAILGSLELAKKRLPQDPKLSALIDNAVTGARRGAMLTKRMLAFARRQEMKTERVSVIDLVRGMTDLLQSALGSSVSIETRFPLSISPIIADENQLEMAILNLGVNARDAMPNGGNIVIAAREETIGSSDGGSLSPGHYVCLSISDTGFGMDAATLRRAVEPFYTTKGVGKGTGLGLSMVHGIAEQLGGRLVLKSEVNKGTVAEMWLPVAGAKLQGSASAKVDPAKPFVSRHLVILVVDDDNLVLTNTVAMLDDLGHAALAASSGAEALDILRRTDAIDLVVTDHVMPNMTGQQLALSISAQWPQIPIILATGYAELERGASQEAHLLSKPFSQRELAAKIAEVAVAPVPEGRVVPLRGK
jgi:CheY-like chemotaxis protein